MDFVKRWLSGLQGLNIGVRVFGRISLLKMWDTLLLFSAIWLQTFGSCGKRRTIQESSRPPYVISNQALFRVFIHDFILAMCLKEHLIVFQKLPIDFRSSRVTQ